jgi:sugar phosphate isomerase/epimerase
MNADHDAANRAATPAIAGHEQTANSLRCAATVSLVPQATGGPFIFWNGLANACAEAARLGFHAIEIFPPGAAEVDRALLRELLDRFHLRVAAIGTGGGWLVRRLHLCHPDALRRDDARRFIHEMIDLAAEFSAPAILGSMQGRAEATVSRDDAFTLLHEALREFDGHAARLGQPFLVEPLNRYETNLFNRLSDVCAVIDALELKAARVLADLFHMNIEEASVPAALRTAGGKIGHIHFADSNRRAIGMGHTDIAPVREALRSISYHGYLSAEILPLPDSTAAATQTMRAFSDFIRDTPANL